MNYNKGPEDYKVLLDGCNYTSGFTNDKNVSTAMAIMMVVMLIRSTILMLMTMTPRSQMSMGIQFSDMLEATGVYRQGQPAGPRPTTYRSDHRP